MSAEAPRGVHIRGGASDQTAYLLDGVPVFSPYHAAGMFSAWNPDALARLQLASFSPTAALPDALSGAITAVTRTPGPYFSAQGSVSTTQARFTVDGPAGIAGSGFLLSLRSGFPSVIAPRDEASYVRGATGDQLAKIEAPAWGGRLRLIGYHSHNEIDAATVADAPDAASPDPGRNAFEWRSRSVGAEWTRAISRGLIRVQMWSAAANASASWATASGEIAYMTAVRGDEGLLGAVETNVAGGATIAGMRVERSRTSYRVESESSDSAVSAMSGRMPIAAVFIQHTRPVGGRTEIDLGASVTSAAGAVHASPRARLRWKLREPLAFSAGYARLHQFAQSLRNPESIVGTIFPVDLYVGAGTGRVPVARSDQAVIAADYRPVAALHLGLQAYARNFEGLLLVAPRAGEPFATGAFATGSGTARGFSLDAAVSAARFGGVASYGWQRVMLEYGDSSYVPEHGTTHLLEAGVIVFPTATSSVRLGAAGALGRRATALSGGLEFEACNLLDQGCEFSGSPHHDAASLGDTKLPAYLRVDLGIRKHWHLEVAGRDASVALFGT
ncbi:MAG: TonB-dependent receptor plug domain-containing protein, partial [Longimicrobiales bacterium]